MTAVALVFLVWETAWHSFREIYINKPVSYLITGSVNFQTISAFESMKRVIWNQCFLSQLHWEYQNFLVSALTHKLGTYKHSLQVWLFSYILRRQLLRHCTMVEQLRATDRSSTKSRARFDQFFRYHTIWNQSLLCEKFTVSLIRSCPRSSLRRARGLYHYNSLMNIFNASSSRHCFLSNVYDMELI